MILIVKFHAFSKENMESFANKDFAFIHESLKKICSTYVLISINEVTAMSEIDNSNLTCFNNAN